MQLRHRAFTLVELLVVIGIIALLISILLPALIKARESSLQVKCASNLRQLALASFNYAGDNKGCMVPFAVSGLKNASFTDSGGNVISGNGIISWDYLQVNFLGTAYYSFADGYLGKYLKTDRVLQCPKFDQEAIPIITVAETYGICNQSINTIAQLQQGSDTAMFADSITYTSSQGLTRPTEIFKPSQVPDSFHGIHSGSGNVAFYDGHVLPVPCQLRPSSTYATAPSAATMAILKAIHIGPLCKTIDFTQISGNSAYITACQNQYDYYFWRNKGQRQ